MPSIPHPEYHEYFVWDAPTRWFHWINALAVIGLMATGIVILSDDALGISAAGKVLLKDLMSLWATSWGRICSGASFGHSLAIGTRSGAPFYPVAPASLRLSEPMSHRS